MKLTSISGRGNESVLVKAVDSPKFAIWACIPGGMSSGWRLTKVIVMRLCSCFYIAYLSFSFLLIWSHL